MVIKKSLAAIPKTLRGKKRYIAFKILTDECITKKDLDKAVKRNFLSLFGSVGFMKIKPKIVEYDDKNKTAIMRSTLDKINEAKAGLIFLNEINSKKISLCLLKTSGTIKSLKLAK